MYNYPKEELKKVLNDKQFFEAQLRGSLKTIGQNRRLESVFKMGNYIRSNKPLQCKIEEKSDNNQNNPMAVSNNNADSANPAVDIQPSMVGRNILKHLKQRKVDEQTIKYSDGQNVVEIKTNDFHHLVKKFATRMFSDMKINIRTESMSKEQFCNWITKHKNLYNSYYSGFHNEIWELDEKTQKPMYLTTPQEKRSEAKYLVAQSQPQPKLIKVQIIFLDSMLILTDEKDESNPVEIICLEGLEVVKNYDKVYGYGIDIAHRDGVFKKRQIFFKNEQVRDEWSEMLKYYKGEAISSRFDMKKKIGAGKFSVVYEGKELNNGQPTGEVYAVKVIESYKLDSDAKNLIAHETSIMQVFSHPLLVQYKESIQTKTHLYIIAELCPGMDLFEYIRGVKYIDEYDAAVITQQMIVGLRYMHSLGIVHRDLKPENIMVSYEGKDIDKIKIIDFGFANYLETLLELPPEENLAGTPNYIAPQLLRREQISFKIDIFALGSILYFMLSGSLPFNDYNLTEIFNRTLDGSYNYSDKIWQRVSDEAKNLIDCLLKNNPDERITLEVALKHPWFQLAKERKNKKTGGKIQRKNTIQVF